jgi:cellulose synthase/poly-beta-1,6-N-acetylglucosamine synthase-like glycosyltransferase
LNTSGSAERIPIAVVVIGRNEGERLRACLTSVLTMNYPRELLDVIYVDSSSTDGSVAMAQGMGVRTVLLDGPTTAARGRNAGWTQTSAPVVLFLDGDTILAADFVSRNLGQFADPTIAGVCGNRREMRTGDSIYNALIDLDWNMAPGFIRYFGGDTLVRRDALVRVNGYNPSLIAGEEPDMCRRMRGLGYRILHVDEAMTLHDIAMYRFGQYWKRSVRTGYAYAQVSSIYAKTADPLWLDSSRANVVRAASWIGGPLVAIVLSIAFRSWIPVSVFALAAVVLWSRTGVRAASRVKSAWVLIVYSIHSHLQQIPVFLGQLRFWTGRARGRGSALMEYKEMP